MEKMPSEVHTVGKPGRHFLVFDYFVRAQPIVDGTIPGLMVLDTIGKQAEQAKMDKPVPTSLHGLFICFCFQVSALTSLDSVISCKVK